MKKWKIVAFAMAATFALGGAAVGGYFACDRINKENYSNSLAEKDDEIKDLQEQLSQFDSDLERLKTQLSNLNKQLQEKEEYLKSLEDSKSLLQSQYDALLAASGSDAEKLDALTKQIATLTSQLEAAEGDKANLQVQLNTKKQQLSELQQELQEKESKITELNQQVSSLTAQIEDYKSQLESAQQSYSNAQARYEELNSQYQELQAQSQQDKLQIQQLNANISYLNNRIAELEKENEELNWLKKGFDPFYILSCWNLKLAEDRYLVRDGRGNICSYNKDHSFKNLLTVSTLGDAYALQSHDAVFYADEKAYFYSYIDDEIMEIEGFDPMGLKKPVEFAEDFVLISASLTNVSGHGPDTDTVVINCKTKEFKILYSRAEAQIITTLGKNILLRTSYFDKSSSSNRSETWLFDVGSFEFRAVSGVGVGSSTLYEPFHLRNGGVLFKYGSSSYSSRLFYFDAQAMSVEVLSTLSEEYLGSLNEKFQMSNGKVLMTSFNNGSLQGLYIFDPTTKSVKLVSGSSTLIDMNQFVEKNGKVTISSSRNSDKYEYDVKSETLTKIS